MDRKKKIWFDPVRPGSRNFKQDGNNKPGEELRSREESLRWGRSKAYYMVVVEIQINIISREED